MSWVTIACTRDEAKLCEIYLHNSAEILILGPHLFIRI